MKADICECPCHIVKSMMHFINCCVWCDSCKERIKRSKYIEHEKNCSCNLKGNK
jgi:hypothetical protein